MNGGHGVRLARLVSRSSLVSFGANNIFSRFILRPSGEPRGKMLHLQGVSGGGESPPVRVGPIDRKESDIRLTAVESQLAR